MMITMGTKNIIGLTVLLLLMLGCGLQCGLACSGSGYGKSCSTNQDCQLHRSLLTHSPTADSKMIISHPWHPFACRGRRLICNETGAVGVKGDSGGVCKCEPPGVWNPQLRLCLKRDLDEGFGCYADRECRQGLHCIFSPDRGGHDGNFYVRRVCSSAVVWTANQLGLLLWGLLAPTYFNYHWQNSA